jgi:predicted nucleic acid-binding Zn ribbon protein
MPTYDFMCQKCGRTDQVMRPIREHVANPRPYFCCTEQMDRWFPPSGLNANENVLAGDRYYDGLRATDGTDISSRSKHREYMRRNGLTTADDFKGTWEKAAKEREAYRQGKAGTGAITRNDIAEAWHRTHRS